MTVEGGTKTEVFLTYVEEFLVPKLSPGKVVIMYNLAVHKIEKVKELIEATGAKVLYLPRYSLDLNPIELCWSKVKAFLKAKSARTKDCFEDFTSQALELITPDFAKAFSSHCGYLR